PIARTECRAEFFGQRAEAPCRRRVLALVVFAHFLDLARLGDGLHTEPNATARWIDLEDDDLDVAANRKRLHHIGFLGHTCLAHGDETCAPGRQEHEDTE